MKLVTCCRCGAQTSSRKFFQKGWMRIELTYDDGNKWRQYTCKACRNLPRVSETPKEAA